MDLEAQVVALRERHSHGEISDADMELMIEGARSKWAHDHPPRPVAEIESASPRAEGENVNIDGNEGARVTRGKMRGAVRVHTASVDGTQAQVIRSAAAASVRSDAHGRRNPARLSGGGPSWTENASTVRDGGIAPEYGYFKFSPDKIAVPKLLEGRHDLATWVESIEPQLEIAQLKKFVDGTVEVPPEDDAERRTEFHSARLLTFMCPDCVNKEAGDGQEALRGRSQNRQPHHEIANHKDKQHSDSKEKQPSDARTSCGNGAKEAPSDDVHHDGQSSCSMVGVVTDASTEPTISLAPEAGKDFQAVAADVQANPTVVLLDSGCSHHLMGTRGAFVEMNAEGDVHHVRGFNGAIQPVQGRGTIAPQGAAGTKAIIPDVLYVPGVQANLLSAGQLKDSGVQFRDTGDETLLVSAEGAVIGCARYTGRVLCTDLRPCSSPQPSVPPTETVALRTIASSTRSLADIWHARLAHAGMDMIKRTAAHGVASGLEIMSSYGADLVCVSCVGGKLVRHTFPDQGSEPENALDVVHIDVCGPFRVPTKDGSRYFLLLRDRKTRFVWTYSFTRKSDALEKFEMWLTVKMIRSDRGGEFLGGDSTAFLDKHGIVHDLTRPYTPH
ncbi:unnamed protein product [Closterium sp. NIES-53]